MKIKGKISGRRYSSGNVFEMTIETCPASEIRTSIGTEITIEIPDPKPVPMTPGERLCNEVHGVNGSRYAQLPKVSREVWEERAQALGITAIEPPKVKSPGERLYSACEGNYPWDTLSRDAQSEWETFAARYDASRPEGT